MSCEGCPPEPWRRWAALRLASRRLALRRFSLRCTREPASREAGTRSIEDDGDNRRTPDDDPFVILIEVQRADRLADEDDQQRAECGIDGAALATGQAGAADHCRRDHVELVARGVDARGRPVKAGAHERR